MEQQYPHLFSPAVVNGKPFRNHILGAPLGVWTFSPDNHIFDYSVDMFAERAAGGVSSVVVGHTELMTGTEEAEPFGSYFDLWNSQKGDAALAEFAHAVRLNGAHVGIQVNHSGGNILGREGGVYYAPSPVERHDGRTVLEMDRARIEATIDRFVQALLRVQRAGFDMAVLHGGHGWLLNQFFSPETNRRSDEYGGCLENRCRFGLELVQRIREAVGREFILEYRISGVDPAEDPQGFAELVWYLNQLEGQIDIVNVSSGAPRGGDATHTFPSYLDARGSNLHLSAPLKAELKTAVAVVGNITDPAFAEQILAEGKADFVSLARALTADPQFPRKARAGKAEDIRPCIGCYNCLETMHQTQFYACDVNPRAGREHRVPQAQQAVTPRKVVVIGGGPAGMEAALTADRMGHHVVLFEQSEALGGLLKLTDGDPVKQLLHNLKCFYITQLSKSGVTLKLNTKATAALVAAEQPDAVLLATGSLPFVPKIPGVDRENVYTCLRAHESGAALGDRVVIIGGNMVGCETAISLKAKGKQVTVLEMTEQFYGDANNILKLGFEKHMRGVEQLGGCRCTAITDAGVRAIRSDGTELLIEADSIVLAVGLRPQRQLAEALSGLAVDYAEIGDCVKPANVRQAITNGRYAAMNLL